MPRRRVVKKRDISPDPVYSSKLVTKFINNLMRRGKKSLAQRIFYQAMDRINSRTGKPPVDIFKKAIDNIRPQLVVKSRRVGGATYQVPVEVPIEKGISIAIRWILAFTRAQKGRSMQEKLADEFINAANNTGPSIKKRDDTHRMAEANRAFTHYRW
ncbi:TPA: 30S ribosomal protein S7 [bacterium]|nr:30S ribosomal protein S7 [bacterium]